MRQWKSQSREREREEEETNLNQKNQNDSQWKMEPGFQAACMTVHKVDRNVNLLVKIPKFLSQQIESRLLLWDFYDYFFILLFVAFISTVFYIEIYLNIYLIIINERERFIVWEKTQQQKKKRNKLKISFVSFFCFFFSKQNSAYFFPAVSLFIFLFFVNENCFLCR